jgi:Zn-finger nucleic acid-binding protein
VANCPICSGDFDAENVNGVTAAFCRKCDGLWLGAGDFDRLTQQDVEHEFDSWMEPPTECRHCQTPLGFGDKCVRCGELPTIHCPLGHGIMNATLVEVGTREFEIDHCPSCRGIWIDGHERQHLDAVEERPTRQLPHLKQIGGIPRGSYKHGTGRSNNFLDELSRGPGGLPGIYMGAFTPQPWNWGKSEPLSLIMFVIIIAGALAALYALSGGALVVF